MYHHKEEYLSCTVWYVICRDVAPTQDITHSHCSFLPLVNGRLNFFCCRACTVPTAGAVPCGALQAGIIMFRVTRVRSRFDVHRVHVSQKRYQATRLEDRMAATPVTHTKYQGMGCLGHQATRAPQCSLKAYNINIAEVVSPPTSKIEEKVLFNSTFSSILEVGGFNFIRLTLMKLKLTGWENRCIIRILKSGKFRKVLIELSNSSPDLCLLKVSTTSIHASDNYNIPNAHYSFLATCLPLGKHSFISVARTW